MCINERLYFFFSFDRRHMLVFFPSHFTLFFPEMKLNVSQLSDNIYVIIVSFFLHYKQNVKYSNE